MLQKLRASYSAPPVISTGKQKNPRGTYFTPSPPGISSEVGDVNPCSEETGARPHTAQENGQEEGWLRSALSACVPAVFDFTELRSTMVWWPKILLLIRLVEVDSSR